MACFGGLLYQVSACLLLAVAIRGHGESTKVSPVPLPYASVGYDNGQESQNHDSHDTTQGSYHHINVPEGYQIPHGYESYLVPAATEDYSLTHEKHSFGVMQTMFAHVQPFLGHVVSVLPKIGVIAISLIVLLAVGTLLTSCVCAYTPLCHMTFLGVNLTPERFRGFMTQDRVSELASFVQSAVKKYQDMNKKSIDKSIDSNEVK